MNTRKTTPRWQTLVASALTAAAVVLFAPGAAAGPGDGNEHCIYNTQGEPIHCIYTQGSGCIPSVVDPWALACYSFESGCDIRFSIRGGVFDECMDLWP